MRKITLILIFISLALPLWAGPPSSPIGPFLPGTSSNNVFTPSQSILIYESIYFSIDAGIDSVISAPTMAGKLQGAIGSNLLTSWANGSPGYDTFTTSGGTISSAIYTGSGTESGSTTITTTAGKLYSLIIASYTKNSGQTPTITCTNTNPAITAANVANGTTYFRATSTSVVCTVSNTAASNWTAAFTSFEYSRPAIYRDFSNSTQQTLVFDWAPPLDWDGGVVYFQPTGVVTSSTAPANTETVIMSMSGYAIASSDSLSQATGTAVNSTFTANATYAQYDEVIFPISQAITIANNPAAGKKVRLILDRLTSGTYAQPLGITGFWLKYGRVLAH